MTTPSLREARSNRLLASLPRAILEKIIPDLDLQPLKMRQVLQARGEALDQVVFPLRGVASMISMGESGESVEVATIGYEGMVGLPLFLGGERAAVEVFMQVPGEGLQLSAAAFQVHMKREPCAYWTADRRTLTRALSGRSATVFGRFSRAQATAVHVPTISRWPTSPGP